MNIEHVTREFFDYLIFIKGYTPDTLRRYKYAIGFYIRHTHIQSITEISESNVKGLFYHGRTERKWSANTYMVFYKSLLVFFRWCVQQQYIAVNPVETLEKPKIEQKLPVRITRQDAHRLLEYIWHHPKYSSFLRCRNYAIIATFLFAGLRKTELLKLSYADVDVDNQTIFIRQGKGSKDRFIPMSPTLAECLKKYIVLRNKKDGSAHEFFISLQNNQPLTDSGLKHFINELRRGTGIRFSVHKLRHSFATMLLEGGCDIYSLSKMMGHTDMKTTAIYLSASAEHMRSQIVKHPLNQRI